MRRSTLSALATGIGSLCYCEGLPTIIKTVQINAKLDKKDWFACEHKTTEEAS